ncbi:hypothetical protein [uncultured Spirosoma sp.]|uniref:hypothetical protein n=1 Tax=uncultured Spirosoma sp. TaxID=278208 RepID=UPI002582C32D|nr:hypothetical protein [uncultured Spirosoma sp.]
MPAPRRRRINIELLLGISATFLSLAALVVSIVQTSIAREQQHASVWPYLQVLTSNLEDELHYGLENKGVGPAIIRDFEITYRGKTYKNVRQVFYSVIGRTTSGGKGFGTVSKGMVFKSGDDMDMLFVTKNDTIVSQVNAMLGDSSFHIRIRYADVYGNCWLLDREKVTELGSCPE